MGTTNDSQTKVKPPQTSIWFAFFIQCDIPQWHLCVKRSRVFHSNYISIHIWLLKTVMSSGLCFREILAHPLALTISKTFNVLHTFFLLWNHLHSTDVLVYHHKYNPQHLLICSTKILVMMMILLDMIAQMQLIPGGKKPIYIFLLCMGIQDERLCILRSGRSSC